MFFSRKSIQNTSAPFGLVRGKITEETSGYTPIEALPSHHQLL